MISKDAEGMIYVDGCAIGRVLPRFQGGFWIRPAYHFVDRGIYASEQDAIAKLVALNNRAARVFAA